MWHRSCPSRAAGPSGPSGGTLVSTFGADTLVKQRKRLFSPHSKDQGVIIATEKMRFINTRPLTSSSPPNPDLPEKSLPHFSSRVRPAVEGEPRASATRVAGRCSNEASAASQRLLNCECTPRLDLRPGSVCVLKVAFCSLQHLVSLVRLLFFDRSANRRGLRFRRRETFGAVLFPRTSDIIEFSC